MGTLRVLANLCSVVPGQVGGSEEYATRLLAAVASAAPSVSSAGESVEPASPARRVSSAGESAEPVSPARRVHLELAAMAGVRDAHPELAGLVCHESSRSGHSRFIRLVVESTWLARRSSGFDIVHHFGGRLPAVRNGIAVLTIYDTQPLDMPENFSLTKRLYMEVALRRSTRSATLLTVPSEWVAQRVVERLNADPQSVRVVHSTYPAHIAVRHCSSSEAAARHCSSSEAADSRHAESWRMGGRFVLYPAATYPHKNHAVLIAAHAAVRARHRDATLVLTGGEGRAHAQVAELVACTPGVVHLGRVEESYLAALFSEAAAVAFPSRYEGFGLPVLEAMAAGTPVIAADATALPEVVADAGLLIGPDDLDGWADALLEARSGSPEIDQRVELGRARARHYAPDKAGALLLGAWREAASVAARHPRRRRRHS